MYYSKPNIASLVFFFVVVISNFKNPIFSQGSYEYEHQVFRAIKCDKNAKENDVKTIKYYKNFKDSTEKGELYKTVFYDKNRKLISRIEYDDRGEKKTDYEYIYSNSGQLKEIVKTHIYYNSSESISKTAIGYNLNGQVEYITNPRIRKDSEQDTVFYYYKKNGRFQYKEYTDESRVRRYIRYNKFGEIEYVDFWLEDPESLVFDEDSCILYINCIKTSDGDDYGFYKYTYNSNSQILTKLEVERVGKGSVENGAVGTSYTYKYNNQNKLVEYTYARCYTRSREKCLKKLKKVEVSKIEYDLNGREVFDRTYKPNGKIKTIYYREYEYY